MEVVDIEEVNKDIKMLNDKMVVIHTNFQNLINELQEIINGINKELRTMKKKCHINCCCCS